MLELFLIQFGIERKITLCYRSDVAKTETVKVEKQSGGKDVPSIVFLVIRHLETEFVRSCGSLSYRSVIGLF